jgi:hypothetical protein
MLLEERLATRSGRSLAAPAVRSGTLNPETVAENAVPADAEKMLETCHPLTKWAMNPDWIGDGRR